MEDNVWCDVAGLSYSAGASLVQWNRLRGNIIASAHDSEIRLWDMRVSQFCSQFTVYIPRDFLG